MSADERVDPDDTVGEEQRQTDPAASSVHPADRPRPQYGEYATPQEQAAAIAARLPRHKHPIEAPVVSGHESSATGVSRVPGTGATPGGVRARAQGSRRPAGMVNRVFTLMLLAIGMVNFMQTFQSYRDLPRTLQTVYDQAGLGEYTMVDLASALGIVAIVVQAILWMVAAVWSFNRLKAGRSSWWIALAGLAVTFLCVVVIMAVAMLVDPAFFAYVGRA